MEPLQKGMYFLPSCLSRSGQLRVEPEESRPQLEKTSVKD